MPFYPALTGILGKMTQAVNTKRTAGSEIGLHAPRRACADRRRREGRRGPPACGWGSGMVGTCCESRAAMGVANPCLSAQP